MTARTLGSLTGADLGSSISAAGVHGVLTSVRHYVTGSDPSAGAITSALVKVATANRREPDHREIRRQGTEPVQVVPARTYQHAA